MLGWPVQSVSCCWQFDGSCQTTSYRTECTGLYVSLSTEQSASALSGVNFVNYESKVCKFCISALTAFTDEDDVVVVYLLCDVVYLSQVWDDFQLYSVL